MFVRVLRMDPCMSMRAASGDRVTLHGRSSEQASKQTLPHHTTPAPLPLSSVFPWGYCTSNPMKKLLGFLVSQLASRARVLLASPRVAPTSSGSHSSRCLYPQFAAIVRYRLAFTK